MPIDNICLGAFYDVAMPPAYYAHLAAFRARFYMEPETSDSESIASGMAGGRGGAGAGPRPTREKALERFVSSEKGKCFPRIKSGKHFPDVKVNIFL